MRDSGFDGSLGEGKTKALPPRGWRAMTACAASLSQTMRGPVLAAACCASCDTRLTAVMHRSQTPLSTWFWGAHLVVSQTKGLSATQFQRQLSRYTRGHNLELIGPFSGSD